jgi:rhodanese-related sulfurtransferase
MTPAGMVRTRANRRTTLSAYSSDLLDDARRKEVGVECSHGRRALRARGRLVEQASLVYERRSLQAAAHAELRKDVLDVRGQRPWADDELVRDLG